MLVQQGFVFVYRLYDIAEEIDLSKVNTLLQTSSRFKLSSNKNSIFIKEAPISFSLGMERCVLNELEYECETLCKVWDYGVISICLKIPIINMNINAIKDLSYFLENDSIITILASDKKNTIKTKLFDSLKQPAEYDLLEDYTSFVFKQVEYDNRSIIDPAIVKEKMDLSSVILAENKIQLSESIRKTILENSLQYSDKDMLVIDWNSSIIVDFTETNDYVEYIDILEFSLSHLLELRIYDFILDDRLNKLYDSMDKDLGDQLNNETYSAISKEAGQIYIEISDVLERVNNSLKVIGDSFYATIIRHINKKFRIEDWEKSTSNKLDKLMNISSILQDRIESRLSNSNEKKSHFFEIIVIILIILEILKGRVF